MTKDADRIFFENGTVAESGTHTELLENGGTYAKMWNVQAENTVQQFMLIITEPYPDIGGYGFFAVIKALSSVNHI